MNKQKRKKRGKKSVQNLWGLQGFTTYGLKTTGGELVYWGNGVEQDREKGLEYIQLAAEQGHPGAVRFLDRLAQNEQDAYAASLFPMATRLSIPWVGPKFPAITPATSRNSRLPPPTVKKPPIAPPISLEKVYTPEPLRMTQ